MDIKNKKLSVGIIGYGVVGKRRRQFIDLNPHFQTVAVCDQSFSDEGIFPDGVHYYRHYTKLLQQLLDVIFVCVPNNMAPEVTIAGLKKNLHIFCEKPPGRNLQDISSVIQVEQSLPHLKLKYGFNHRYHNSVREASAIIKTNVLGNFINMRGMYGKSKIIDYESTWRGKRVEAGGGVLLDQGIHMVDLMRYFAGEFTEIHSFISNSYWHHDVEDNAYALMQTKDGIVAMLHSSATQWRHRFSLEIALTKGAIILSGILSGSKSYGSEKLTIIHTDTKGRDAPKEITTLYDQDNSWQDEIDEFVNCIIENRPIESGSSLEAFKTMQLVYQIYCADKKWQKRYNLECTVPHFELEGLTG